jgi:calcineurin-like phosphoesterase family protein
MAVFFTADTHFGHHYILYACNRHSRFSSIEEMDRKLIESINKCVGSDDELWHLGDFSLAHRRSALQTARYYRERIECRNMNLIYGNHDRPEIAELFRTAHALKEITVDGQRIVLCHYALAIWHHAYKGVWHLYGHSHSKAEDWLDQMMPARKSLDVGMDNAYRLLHAYRPWTMDDLKTYFAGRTGFEHASDLDIDGAGAHVGDNPP